ncbi:DUF3331 domain-containing protein [Cupriavidus necator]|uniref:DUF3331 domain-containing protein n=1 Tax=Cupriavidus necator TaxID=106590 RepID=UPI003AF36792
MYFAGQNQTARRLSNFSWASPPRLGVTTSLDRQRTHAQISLIENESPGTVVLSWHDATGGSYGNQTWHRQRAIRGGACALTGKTIRPGDSVFRPDARNAANAMAMILDASLKALRMGMDYEDETPDD